MPARQKSTPADSSAHPGCEATARRGSANPKGKAIPRSLKGNLWLAADSRNAVKTAEGNRSNTMDAAEPGGANRVERDSLLKAARRAHAAAFINPASRPRATPTSPGCSPSSTTSRRKAWPALTSSVSASLRLSSPTAACPPTSPAKAKSPASFLQTILYV